MLVKPIDGNEIYDAAALLQKASDKDNLILNGGDVILDLGPIYVPVIKYEHIAFSAILFLPASAILWNNIDSKPIAKLSIVLLFLAYISYIFYFFINRMNTIAAVRELMAHHERVVIHNRKVRERISRREREEMWEQQREQQAAIAKAKRIADELNARKKRDVDMFLNEYMKFEFERQRRAELVYITAPLVKAFWSDYLALADLSPTPFNPEVDFRKYFWELFNEAARNNKNKVDAMRCIHEINDPLLQQAIGYIKPDLPPRWPRLIPSAEWVRLKNPSVPLDAQMSDLRKRFSKPGSLPLYLDTLELPIQIPK